MLNLWLHLAAYDDTIGLERFIQLSIKVATRIQSCMEGQGQQFFTLVFRRPEDISPPEPGYEHMQLETTRLSQTKRQRHLTHGLCIYWGASGHVISTCPIHPSRPLVSVIQAIYHQYETTHHSSSTYCLRCFQSSQWLFDSCSAGNFISSTLCCQLNLSTTTKKTIYQVRSITGKPLSRKHIHLSVGPLKRKVGQLHEETLHLLVLEDSTADVILGHSWLVQHNPILSWESGEVLNWGKKCFPDWILQIPQVKLSHLYLYSAFNNTNCVKPTAQY